MAPPENSPAGAQIGAGAGVKEVIELLYEVGVNNKSSQFIFNAP